MDLDNFPTSESAKKMLRSVTEGFYDNSYVGKWIFQVMGLEMDDAEMRVNELAEQVFPETATWGIRYLEQKYNLKENTALSLEERRKIVLGKRKQFRAMNPALMENRLKDLTGSDAAEVTEYAGSYNFDVWIQDIEETVNYGKVLEYIRKVKPSHMAMLLIAEYNPQFTVDVTASSQIVFNSSVYPRFNYPVMYLDGSWLLDGKYSLGGFKAGDSLDFYPVFLFLQNLVNAQSDIKSVMHVAGGQAVNTLTAEVHPAFRQPYLISVTSLSQLKHQWNVLFKVGHEGRLTARQSLNISVNGSSSTEPIAGIRAEVLPELNLSSQNKCIISSVYEAALTIEHDWWTLDGTSKLDGMHGLNPWVSQEQL